MLFKIVALEDIFNDSIMIILQLFKFVFMAFLLNLFSHSPPPPAEDAICHLLRQLKLDSLDPLPDNYLEMLFPTSLKETHINIFTQIIHSLPEARTEAAVIKLYTIIMCAIRMSEYDSQYSQALEQLQEAEMCQKSQRLVEVEKSCRSYLAKLPSMCDIYQNSISPLKNQQVEDAHVPLFRTMNQFSLLFPFLNTAINTVGRYYRESLLFYKQFYRVWRAEVLLGYLQIKKTVDDMLNNYQTKHSYILQCFLHSVPQIELLSDQLECFITNKYFKGKSPNRKIYFSAEKQQELEYYLGEMQRQAKRDEDFIRTAEDDFFSVKYKQ